MALLLKPYFIFIFASINWKSVFLHIGGRSWESAFEIMYRTECQASHSGFHSADEDVKAFEKGT